MIGGELKAIISGIGVALTFLSYIPYLRDTLIGKTKPHVYTWFVWGLLTAIIAGLQIEAGAGVGVWTTLAASFLSFAIFALGLKDGKKNITKVDTAFLIASLFGLVIWLLAKQPLLSTFLLLVISMLGFGPTIRKSWHLPHTETLATYVINTFRHLLSLLALEQYTPVTWLYPGVWAVANGLFSVLLIVRRRQTN